PACPGGRVELHHVVHRSRKGAHTSGNLVSLCRFHHDLVHVHGWTVEVRGRGRRAAVWFTGPSGLAVGPVPRDRRRRGSPEPLPLAPGGAAAVDPAWTGEHFDLAGTVAELLRRS